jgi:hypothetical protein
MIHSLSLKKCACSPKYFIIVLRFTEYSYFCFCVVGCNQPQARPVGWKFGDRHLTGQIKNTGLKGGASDKRQKHRAGTATDGQTKNRKSTFGIAAKDWRQTAASFDHAGP